jgi:hypothetical protein
MRAWSRALLTRQEIVVNDFPEQCMTECITGFIVVSSAASIASLSWLSNSPSEAPATAASSS